MHFSILFHYQLPPIWTYQLFICHQFFSFFSPPIWTYQLFIHLSSILSFFFPQTYMSDGFRLDPTNDPIPHTLHSFVPHNNGIWVTCFVHVTPIKYTCMRARTYAYIHRYIHIYVCSFTLRGSALKAGTDSQRGKHVLIRFSMNLLSEDLYDTQDHPCISMIIWHPILTKRRFNALHLHGMLNGIFC